MSNLFSIKRVDGKPITAAFVAMCIASKRNIVTSKGAIDADKVAELVTVEAGEVDGKGVNPLQEELETANEIIEGLRSDLGAAHDEIGKLTPNVKTEGTGEKNSDAPKTTTKRKTTKSK